jgi:hypothetical protein
MSSNPLLLALFYTYTYRQRGKKLGNEFFVKVFAIACETNEKAKRMSSSSWMTSARDSVAVHQLSDLIKVDANMISGFLATNLLW